MKTRNHVLGTKFQDFLKYFRTCWVSACYEDYKADFEEQVQTFKKKSRTRWIRARYEE